MNVKEESRFITFMSLVITSIISLIFILFSGLKGWTLVIIVLFVILGGQALRFLLKRNILGKSMARNGGRISKKEMEMEVRIYFKNNPSIAKKFLRLDGLVSRKKYHDALVLASSLKREPLSPVVRKYIEFKIEKLKKLKRFGIR
ncbi:MAG: hypothetical protein ACTSRA_01960 [Promethearchaeota archaeon]